MIFLDLFFRNTLPLDELDSSRGELLESIKIRAVHFQCCQLLPASPSYQDYLTIRPLILEAFNHDQLQAGDSLLLHTPCLVGRGEQMKVAIVIHSLDKGAREFVYKLIRRSPEWKRFAEAHPCFMLLSLGHAPRLAALAGIRGVSNVLSGGSRLLSLGSPLCFSSIEHQSAPVKRMATAGVHLRIRRQNYVLTVAHPLTMADSEPRWPAENDTISDVDEEDDNAVSFHDLDQADDAFIDQYEISPESAASYMSSSVSSTDGHPILYVQGTFEAARRTQDYQTCDVPIGEIECFASPEEGNTYDWLLCKLNDATYQKMRMRATINTVAGGNELVSVRGVAEIPRINRTVLVVANAGQPFSATLLSTPADFRFSTTSEAISVLMLRSQTAMQLGDCGAAVIDSQTGAWFGHLIACDHLGLTGFVVSATNIIEEISHTLKIPRSDIRLCDPATRKEYLTSRSKETRTLLRCTTSTNANAAELHLRERLTELTESEMEAIAQNRHYGARLMKVVFETWPRTTITDTVLVSAVSNEGCGLDIIKVLCDNGWQAPVVEKNTLKIASENASFGKEILMLLVRSTTRTIADARLISDIISRLWRNGKNPELCAPN